MLLVLALCLTASPIPTVDAQFSSLKALVGEWDAPAGKGKVVHASYRLISNDSVLVETYSTGPGRSTMTVFHRDGDELIATHYCAQGNQPRLKSEGSVNEVIRFVFWDVTNLKVPLDSHLVRLELGLVDHKKLLRRETYLEAGIEDVAELTFSRSK